VVRRVDEGAREALPFEEGKRSRCRSRDGVRAGSAAPKGGFVLTFATTETVDSTDTETLQRAPETRRPRGTVRAAFALTGVLGLTAIAAQLGGGATARAANLDYYWKAGYYQDNGWLCYGWANGAYHCTQHWHVANGRLVSDNPAWVPNYGASDAGQSTGHAPQQSWTPSHPSYAPGHVQGSTTAGEPCRSSVYFNGVPSQWEVAPGCYGGIYAVNPSNYVYRPGFGWCNWWPEVMNPTRPDLLWGNYRRGGTPVPGATVVFAGGVQGASAEGHFGRVVAVYPGGQWILISEMNFYWRGGGWQRVDYRYVHVGWGVSFIY
jgi:hypothetical protein